MIAFHSTLVQLFVRFKFTGQVLVHVQVLDKHVHVAQFASLMFADIIHVHGSFNVPLYVVLAHRACNIVHQQLQL